ncbi:MAG: redoxin domain-containing protein [Planctomycetaceae bacterium]
MRWLLKILVCLSCGVPATAAAPSVVGHPIDSFTLTDFHGQKRSLEDFGEAKVVVVAFLGTECPLARHYGRKLGRLSADYADRGVMFLGIDSNVQDSLTEVSAYASKYEIPFPILLDAQQKVADIFGAQRTPEVFVLDQNRVVRYRGRVDDQYGISIQKAEANQSELLAAIDAILDGNPVAISQTKPVGCLIGRQRAVEPHGEITYATHVADILNRRCVECHRDRQIAPFSLATFEDTQGWEAMMAEVIEEERMPPWTANPAHGSFRNDARLTDSEKETLLTWIRNGSPLGDESAIPEPPQFADGWRMPEPDMVIEMADEPATVPATGVVDYQYFPVDPGFEEDMYVTHAECRPGNPEVVHHIIAYLRAPGAENDDILRTMLVGYAPGCPPLNFGEGSAVFIPKGSKLLIEVHYTPNGYEQTDLSSIGLKFAKKEDVENIVYGGVAINPRFRIPPNASDHVVTAEQEIQADIEMMTLTPHMHLRGKSFNYVARYPDGTEETLLDVPHYDFNWQFRYELAEPKLIPKGTVIKCTATFDNSEGNPNNPAPDETVSWGEQSWEEMMIGFFQYQLPKDSKDIQALKPRRRRGRD